MYKRQFEEVTINLIQLSLGNGNHAFGQKIKNNSILEFLSKYLLMISLLKVSPQYDN